MRQNSLLKDSVVPMIDYNPKSFIYMQPILILGIDFNRKNPQAKEVHFYLTLNAKYLFNLVIK